VTGKPLEVLREARLGLLGHGSSESVKERGEELPCERLATPKELRQPQVPLPGKVLPAF
jgi:hypothetical protein